MSDPAAAIHALGLIVSSPTLHPRGPTPRCSISPILFIEKCPGDAFLGEQRPGDASST